MTEVFVAEGTLKLRDQFSPELDQLIKSMFKVEEQTVKLQEGFDKLGLGSVVRKIDAQWGEIAKVNQTGIDRVMKSWATMDAEGSKAFGGLVRGADTAFGEVLSASVKMQGDVLEEMKATSLGSIEALKGIGSAAPELFAPIGVAAASASREAITSIEGVTAAVRTAATEMKGLGAISAGGVLPTAGAMRPHGVGRNSPHGGLHLRGHGVSVPGGHVGFSGDGTAEAVGAFGGFELLKGALDRDIEMGTIASQYMQNGFTSEQIADAKKAAWANTRNNPNASALEGFGDILELNKATGNLGESIETLPAMSGMDVLMKSVKGKDYHREGQILNYAKGLEELGVTQMGANPEERRASIEKYTREFERTMVSSRGLFDGNALFAMTNNSGGAASGWDMRMATTVAPILGDIMKHGRMGNADYMATKSYAGGGITSKAIEGLIKYGLVDKDLASGNVWQDNKKQWHLNANSEFSEGLTENVYDWSGRMRERLAEHGFDPTNQKVMRGVTNVIGSNKSNTMLMRAVLEPMTRGQITKEIALRDAVPENPIAIAQKNSPVLKIDAFKKSWENFETALGTGLTGPAMDALGKLTAGLTTLGQTLEAHPALAKVGTDMALAVTGILGLSAAVKLLGINVGGAKAATQAAAAGGGAGAAGGMWGKVGAALGLFAAADVAKENNVFQVKRSGLSGALEFLDPGLADRFLGTVDGSPVSKLSNPFISPAAAAVPLPALRPGFTFDAPNHDGNALHRWDEMPAKAAEKMGALSEKTGFVLTSFETLKGGGTALNDNFKGLSTGSGSLDNVFSILEATGMGAARALASVAMSGGMGGGGSGIINASYGGEGLSSGGLGGGSISPLIQGSRHGGSGGGGSAPAALGALSAGRVTGSILSRGDDAMAHLMSLGVTREAASAIVGNAQQESSISGHGPLGDHGTAHGMFQWRFDRFDALQRFAAARGKPWQDEHTELEFMVEEAKKRGNAGWLHGHDIYAANQGMQRFEQYGESADHGNFRTRLGNANMWANRHAGATVSAGRPAVPTITAPPKSKGVQPGAPANGPMTTAMNDIRPQEHHIYLDGKKIAKVVTKHQAIASRFPTDMGGPDTHGHYTSPGTPITDAA